MQYEFLSKSIISCSPPRQLCLYTCMFCMHVFVYLCVCVFVYLCVCVFVCLCVCVFAYLQDDLKSVSKSIISCCSPHPLCQHSCTLPESSN